MAQKNSSGLVGYAMVGILAWIGLKFFTIPYTETPYAVRLRAYIAKAWASGQNIFFTIRIENPNTRGVVIRSIVGDVFINNLRIGTVAHYGNDLINGNAQSTIQLQVTLKVANVVLNLLNVLANKTSDQVLTFNGTVNINDQPQRVVQSIALT